MKLTLAVVNFYFAGIIVIYGAGDFNVQGWKFAYYSFIDIFVCLLFYLLIFLPHSQKTRQWRTIMLITAGFWLLQAMSWEGLAAIIGYHKAMRSQVSKAIIAALTVISVWLIMSYPYLKRLKWPRLKFR